MFYTLIFSLTINLSSGIYPDSLKIVSAELADTSYAENIRIADSNMTILNNCIVAKKHYQTALSFRPNDSYAMQKIMECDELLNQHACGYPGIEPQYQKILAAAEKYFQAKDYPRALEFYSRALQIKPTDIFVQERVQICNDITRNSEYDSYIQTGDSAFVRKNWLFAKQYYYKALSIRDEIYPQEKIRMCDEILQNNQTEELAKIEYQDIINSANKYFETEDYEHAKALYKHAVIINPNDAFVLERIKICD